MLEGSQFGFSGMGPGPGVGRPLPPGFSPPGIWAPGGGKVSGPPPSLTMAGGGPGRGVTLVMPFLQPALASTTAMAKTVGKISLFMFIYFVQVKIRCRACEFLSLKKLPRPSGLGTASRRSHTILVLFRENV